MENSNGFYLMVNGQVLSGKLSGSDPVYCRYQFTYGYDWAVMHGVEDGLSQLANTNAGEDDVFTWNYPIDLTFRSSNVHGWPQIVLSVYGLRGESHLIRGYGCTHMPTTPGRHVRYVRLYRPVSSSWWQKITAWFSNNPPTFFDQVFVAQSKGREVTRVQSEGCVKLVLNVTTKDMVQWGYIQDGERDGIPHVAVQAMPPQPQTDKPSGLSSSKPLARIDEDSNNNGKSNGSKQHIEQKGIQPDTAPPAGPSSNPPNLRSDAKSSSWNNPNRSSAASSWKMPLGNKNMNLDSSNDHNNNNNNNRHPGGPSVSTQSVPSNIRANNNPPSSSISGLKSGPLARLAAREQGSNTGPAPGRNNPSFNGNDNNNNNNNNNKNSLPPPRPPRNTGTLSAKQVVEEI